MSDVLLVNAPVRDPGIDGHARASPPLGLASIAAVLQREGFEIAALDLNILQSPPDEVLEEILLAEKPKILGISSATESYPQAVRLAALVKRIDVDILTVIGGPHVTFMPDEALKTRCIDVVVRGEGEVTMLEVVQKWANGHRFLDGIQGISFRHNGSIYHAPGRPLITNLDSLPIPFRELFPLDRYQYPGNLVTARGCPARCIFCAAPALSGGKYRVRSPERVVQEIDQLVSVSGLSRVTIVDDTFTVYRERTSRICDALAQMRLPLRWGCSTRASSVNRELLAKMREAGCDEIQFGVESGSEAVLASLGKAITLAQVRRAVQWAQDVGMDVTCSFMFPHPRDTRETIRETRELMRELVRKGVRASVAVTTPFPGTELWKRADKWGLEIESHDWRDYDACTPVFSTPTLQKKDISLILTDLMYRGP